MAILEQGHMQMRSKVISFQARQQVGQPLEHDSSLLLHTWFQVFHQVLAICVLVSTHR